MTEDQHQEASDAIKYEPPDLELTVSSSPDVCWEVLFVRVTPSAVNRSPSATPAARTGWATGTQTPTMETIGIALKKIELAFLRVFVLPVIAIRLRHTG
ncbi:MAG: hypothetical protein U5K38_17175 [Woeseiaceae bacterium]|nr:hypothetical protein [Woeseiaceae bacterium]